MLEPEITATAHDVWDTMFGIELVPAAAVPITGRSVTSVVHIEGAWQGAVTVQCSASLAAMLTERLFGERTDDEMRDLLGELANQLGGNIKAMLDAPSTLSLPAVALGADYDLQVVDTRVVASVSFTCEGEPLTIALLERRS